MHAAVDAARLDAVHQLAQQRLDGAHAEHASDGEHVCRCPPRRGCGHGADLSTTCRCPGAELN
jgi:hypothetical protein